MSLVLAVLLAVLGPLQASERAARVATVQVDPTPSTVALDGPCAEWGNAALAAGWPAEQWPRLAGVMWCESRCNPHAHNRSGASGLLQVMPGWWHGRDPYDADTNLAIGLEVYRAQGWRAWSCA